MIKRADWKWYGQATHFICANECRFHMATRVGALLVSTVGAWMQDSIRKSFLDEENGLAKWEAWIAPGLRLGLTKPNGMHVIGAERFYETAIFEIGGYCETPDCDCGGLPNIGENVAMIGYSTSAEAQAGHIDVCEEYSTDEKQKEAVDAIVAAKIYAASFDDSSEEEEEP